MKGSKTFMNDFKFFINLNESFTINKAKKPEPTKEEVENLRKQFEQALKKDWGEISKSIKLCINKIGDIDPDKISRCKIMDPSKAASSGIYNKPYGKFVGIVFAYEDHALGAVTKFNREYRAANIRMVEKNINSTVESLNEYSKKHSNKIKFFADPDIINKKYYITAMLINPN